jgi:hypothetical protein
VEKIIRYDQNPNASVTCLEYPRTTHLHLSLGPVAVPDETFLESLELGDSLAKLCTDYRVLHRGQL